MKRFIPLALVAAGLTVWLGLRGESWDRAKASEGGKTMLKAVVHINFAESERQKHGLKNVANILKEEKGAEIEVVCHGGGIGLLVKDKSEHADEVARLIKDGVRFAACENTLRDRSIAKVDLLSGVDTVPSGAVEVLRKQQEGYGYFRP
ncbi:MAG: DsrE family protein [Acidobacteria bacterium]|nr:DsrE family protein [Acidobacteriota bacterium]